MPTETTSASASHSTVVTVLSLALQALSQRVVLLIGLAATIGLFSWAMYEHTVLSLYTAGSFAVLVFLPVLWRSHAQNG